MDGVNMVSSESSEVAQFVAQAQEVAQKPAKSTQVLAGALMISASVKGAQEYARNVSPEYAQTCANVKSAQIARADALDMFVPESALTLAQAREARALNREGAGINTLVGMVKTPQENIAILAKRYEKTLATLKARERAISAKKD
jgi:hypothetical protein